MPKRTIPLARLTVGMYIVGVDLSWFQTPFLRHKFMIRDEKEIAAFRKAGISEVVVDTSMGLDPDAVKTASAQKVTDHSAQAVVPATETVPNENVERPSARALAAHFSEARQQRQEWINRTNALFERTRATDIVELTEVQQIVDGVLDSILERQAACLAVLGLRQPDPTLQEHGLTVCTLSLVLGKVLGLAEPMMHQLGMGALLHDIGLSKLPRNIIKRPKAMSPAQQALYRTHMEQGTMILEKSGLKEPVVLSIAKGHHESEKLDQGSTATVELTDVVRLVNVIDHYDELITGQTGLTPMSSNQALTQLYQRFRAHPDWLVMVSSLIRIIGVYPLYSLVSLTSGEIGVVGAITPGKAHLPYLYICRDEQKRSCVPPTPVDLVQEPEGGRRIQDVQDPAVVEVDIEQVLKQVAA